MTAIVCVQPTLFSPQPGGIRMGDLIAVCNLIEDLRKRHELPDLQFIIPDEALFPSDHVFKMRDWLMRNTNYLVNSYGPDDMIPLFNFPSGTDETYPNMINLWNIRKDVLVRKQHVFDIEDAVQLPCTVEKKNKIVIAPLMDAPYNADRNWSFDIFASILRETEFRDIPVVENSLHYEQIIICKEPIPGFNSDHWKYSHNFNDNLQHVMECSLFIGGDSGFSHFASALTDRPECYFYYPKLTYGTTNPFYWLTRGNMIYY